MTVGIFRRISDYGLTINRAYVLIFNFWLYGISIYLFITQSKYLKYIIYSFSIIALIISIGPWSVYSITKHTLLNETNELLISMQYLENGKIKIAEKLKSLPVNEKNLQKLDEKVSYLALNYGSGVFQNYFNQNTDTLRYGEIRKLMNLNDDGRDYKSDKNFSFNLKSNTEVIDIKSYTKILKIRSNFDEKKNNDIVIKYENEENAIKLKVSDKIYVFPTNAFLQSLSKCDENDMLSAEQLSIEIADAKLLIEFINFREDNSSDKYFVDNFQGWLLIK